MDDFEAFTLRALFDNLHTHRFTASLDMDRVKTGQALPLPPTGPSSP